MSDKNEKRPGYWKLLAASAPVYGAKALGVDLPKKTLEEAYELKTKSPGSTMRSNLGRAFRGRGAGTAAAGLAGMATAPLFIRGVQLAKSDKRSDKVKGVGLIGGSGLAYHGVKGLGEGIGSAKSRGLSGQAASSRRGAFAASRMLLKTPAAVALGLSIAQGRKKNKDGKQTVARKYLVPAVGAGAAGAANNVVSEVLSRIGQLPKGQRAAAAKKILMSGKGLRSLRATGLGGLAGGAAAGSIGSALVDYSLKRLKKNERGKS